MGHSDFSINIPVGSLSNDALAEFLPGISVSALYFPWRIEDGRLSPFVGISWMPFSFSAKQNETTHAPAYHTHGSAVSGGMLLPFSFGRFELAAARLLNTTYDYPLPNGGAVQLEIPAWQFSLGFKYAFETTLAAESFRESGREAVIEKQLADDGALNDFYGAVGISSSFFLECSQYVKHSLPQLSVPVPGTILPEFSAGYYRHDLDATAQISFRPHTHSQNGYGIAQSWKRTSVTADLLKFIGDYQGFVPFAGISCGWEQVAYRENGGIQPRECSDNGVTLGILAGWDIRPNRLQSFTIRTAVRWNISRSISVAEPNDMNFGNLEINFFQLVLYPARMF